MIEIRHDEILEPAGVALWADRLARTLESARGAISGMPVSLGQQTTSQPGGNNG
jgi:predicted N-formylglutamate amidohydrolase